MQQRSAVKMDRVPPMPSNNENDIYFRFGMNLRIEVKEPISIPRQFQ